MSAGYRAVQWNAFKRQYDLWLWVGIAAYLVSFIAVGFIRTTQADETTLLIRALGSAAYVLLHLTLCIGPLARLNPRFLPLLYNRRHLGVSVFALAALHAFVVTFHFHSFGDLPPLVSLFSSGSPLERPWGVPFELFGAAALFILFAMAATSHDFWLRQLTPPIWKALHMGVYLAWGLLVLHVAFGFLQQERDLYLLLAVSAGVALVLGLHLAAARLEQRRDQTARPGDWIDTGPVTGIKDGSARVVDAGGERVAIFRDGDALSALSNVCRHQNGPLGEGRIVAGLITCPWHGYQYRLADGCSPPPFNEQVPTFRLRIADGRVWLDPKPNPLGTMVAPVLLSAGPLHKPGGDAP
jgi:Ferredoxin subunits of nitrite reductase and ring-hydroxylating dioxygenases